MATEDGKVPAGSLTKNAGDPSLARGAAGSEGGAHQDLDQDDVNHAREADPKGSLEDRRETQQVSRPTSDGVGEGLPKDAA